MPTMRTFKKLAVAETLVVTWLAAGCSSAIPLGTMGSGPADSGPSRETGAAFGDSGGSSSPTAVGDSGSYVPQDAPTADAPPGSGSIPLPGTGSPAKAADGWILFDSDVVGLVRHIFAVRADGTGLTQLTTGTSNDSEAVVSPDGSTIVFTSDRAGAPQLFAVNVATKAIRALGSPANSGQAAFSPDSSTIAFFSASATQYSIYLVNADGTSSRQVIVSTKDGAMDYYEHPVFTPDGAGLIADRYNLIDVFDLSGNKKEGLLPGWSQESLWPVIQRNGVNIAFVTTCTSIDDSIVIGGLNGPLSTATGNCGLRAGSARNLGPLSHPSWGPGTLVTFAHQSSACVSRIVVGDASNPGAEGVELVQDTGDQQNPFWAPTTFQP